MRKKKSSFSISAYYLFFNLFRFEEIAKKKANFGFIQSPAGEYICVYGFAYLVNMNGYIG